MKYQQLPQQHYQNYQCPQQKSCVSQQEREVNNVVFNVNNILGKGAFGSVYLGTDKQIQKQVAIKVIPKSIIKQNSNYKTYITREIESMKELNSPHIVKLYRHFETENNVYLIQEYCKKGNLSDFIKKKYNNQLSESQAISIIKQIALGCQEMQKFNFVHRDLKPANILVDEAENIKIADFGLIAQAVQENNFKLQSYVGTPLYMSPQVLQSEPYTSKADVWSLGLIFYELLFQKYPWTIRDMFSLVQQIKTVPLRFPYDKPIKKLTKQFIEACLQMNEQNRYSWEHILNSQLILSGGHNCGELCHNQEIKDKKSKNILKRIQDIASQQKDPQRFIIQLFCHYDVDASGSLDKQEFSKFLRKIDPNIKQHDADRVFELIDLNNDNSLSLNEFQSIFNTFDFTDLGDEVGNLLNEIRAILQHRNHNLMDLFKKFDPQKYGTFCIVEFTNFIKSFIPQLKDSEIKKIFQRFDNKGKGQINYNEFKNILEFEHECQDHCSEKNSQGSSLRSTLQFQQQQDLHQNRPIASEQQYEGYDTPQFKNLQKQQNYQNKNDIPDNKPNNFQNNIKQQPPDQIQDQIMKENQELKQKVTMLEKQVSELKLQITKKDNVIEYQQTQILKNNKC